MSSKVPAFPGAGDHPVADASGASRVAVECADAGRTNDLGITNVAMMTDALYIAGVELLTVTARRPASKRPVIEEGIFAVEAAQPVLGKPAAEDDPFA